LDDGTSFGVCGRHGFARERYENSEELMKVAKKVGLRVDEGKTEYAVASVDEWKKDKQP